jgi:hypothetical protein
VRPVLCVLVCLAVGASASRADDKREKPAYKLNLKPADGLPNGKVATLQGTANPGGDKFFVESVGVLQPVVVTLVAKNKGDAIKLVLAKQRWDENLRSGTTGPDGMVTLKLRTQGELRMIVSGEGDKPYNLIVWVGDEVKPDFDAAPAITPMKDYKGSKAGAAAGSGTTEIVIACVLGGLIIMLVVWLKRKGAKR